MSYMMSHNMTNMITFLIDDGMLLLRCGSIIGIRFVDSISVSDWLYSIRFSDWLDSIRFSNWLDSIWFSDWLFNREFWLGLFRIGRLILARVACWRVRPSSMRSVFLIVLRRLFLQHDLVGVFGLLCVGVLEFEAETEFEFDSEHSSFLLDFS